MSECELCRQDGGRVAVRSADWRVVLVDEPDYPGFCRVIWNHHVREMADLEPGSRNALMDVVWQVEQVVQQIMQPHKINLASLGNVVPHLHWHVIPRFQDDRHFPNPVWGVPVRESGPATAARHALTGALFDALRNQIGSRA